MKKRVQKYVRIAQDQRGAAGSGLIITIIMAVVAVLITFQLVPEIITANATIQNGNGSDLTKFAGNLGEWFVPVAAVVGGGFIIWRTIR